MKTESKHNSSFSLKLSSGISIPAIGFGPGMYRLDFRGLKHPNSPVGVIKRFHNRYIVRPTVEKRYTKAIISALENGFRLIDYSETYRGYKYLRAGIERSGISRKELFLTTRIGNAQQMKGVKTVRESFLRGLDEMGTDYFDLLQFHWPVTGFFQDTWLEMLKLREKGYVRTLGVANCHPHHLEALYSISGEWPAVNQIEVHPLFTQKPLVGFCRQRGIVVEAYTPVARYDDRLVRLPLLKKIAANHRKSIVQVVLRWHLQNGIIPVIRSMNPAHQKSNLEIFDFALSQEEIEQIDSININSRLRYDPDNCDFTIL